MMDPLPAAASPLRRALHRLWHAIPHKQLTPCVKGRFYDQMQRKLEQLTRSPTNEIVSLDFCDIAQRLTD